MADRGRKIFDMSSDSEKNFVNSSQKECCFIDSKEKL